MQLVDPDRQLTVLRALDARVHVVAPDAPTRLVRHLFRQLVESRADHTDSATSRTPGQQITDVLIEAVDPADQAHRRYRLISDEVKAGGVGIEWMPEELISVVNHAAAHAASAAHGVLHGAVVDLGSGSVVLCGASGAGKTTVAASAILAGHGYVADEVAAWHPDTLRVRSFHRPLGIRRDSAVMFGLQSDPNAPDDMLWPAPADRCIDGTTVYLVALVHRDVDLGEATLQPLAPPAALVALSQHTLAASQSAVSMFHRLDDLVRRVPVVELRAPSAPAAVEALSGWR